MVNLSVICIGRLKEQYLRDASKEYEKRLSPFKISITELNEERIGNNPSEKEIQAVIEAEGRRIIEKLPKGAAVYTMCIEGKHKTSEELSSELDSLALSGISNAVFIIGGSYGLSEDVKKLSRCRLSMSKMTFPHQLARIMLLEQLYRATQISAGTKYHK
ncbi:MAG: 23S rRNA (pseudouridine(1915)-N(3))-methyltransferase RlmH [Clostridia bacterium]|nr:23S rRNA (pseudouridine(1915)-N(3))-methyltransferase RlmH [Clostridia bacterium]